MTTIETQFGIAHSADFEENTWTFLMPEDYRVVAGEFAIVDKKVFDEMRMALKVMRTYLNENTIDNDERKMHYDMIDNAIRLNEPVK